jgi:serine O-acetyltransferase
MEYLKRFIKNILGFIVFLRFKNIWNLKKYLKDNNIDSGINASIYYDYLDKKGSYIGHTSYFKSVPYFPHGLNGIFISDKANIGKNAIIYQQVTIGSINTKGSKNIGSPTIGDNCYIGAGAKILGKIKIGNNCRIGANAVVAKDMPDNSVAYVSNTIIKVKNTKMDNKYYKPSELDEAGE